MSGNVGQFTGIIARRLTESTYSSERSFWGRGGMRTILCGYYGMGNGGDEALLATALQMLPPTADPIVLSGQPQLTQQQYQVEAVPRKSPGAVWRALRRADAFVWGGGSLMQDATSRLNPLYYGGLMGLAQQMELKTVAWAQGIGPLNQPLTRRITRRMYGHCSAISVRDPGSAQQLAAWSVPAVLAPDPVWALERDSVAGLWDLPAPRIAITLRTHPDLTPQRLSTITKALSSLQTATGACIVIVPFQLPQDLAIAQAIQDGLSGPNHLFQLQDPRQLAGLFKGVDMAIAMRLHGVIMAAAAACRTFAISYDPKIDQLMQTLSIPGWTLNQMPTNAATMSRVWLEHFVNGSALSTDQIQSLRDRALIHRDILRAALAT
ncbi:MAG: polysaccharide pyruvyl transferase CsaB [Elainellaceae cyanobacterium]